MPPTATIPVPCPAAVTFNAGATIATLEYISGRKLEPLASKPSTLIVEIAIQRLGVRAHLCMMIGDRLETGIPMGQQADMVTTVTLAGVATRADVLRMPIPPILIADSLAGGPGLVL